MQATINAILAMQVERFIVCNTQRRYTMRPWVESQNRGTCQPLYSAFSEEVVLRIDQKQEKTRICVSDLRINRPQ